MIRIYGKDGLLFGVMSAFMRTWAGVFVVAMPASSQARVIGAAERDAQRMVMRGYRVVSSDPRRSGERSETSRAAVSQPGSIWSECVTVDFGPACSSL